MSRSFSRFKHFFLAFQISSVHQLLDRRTLDPGFYQRRMQDRCKGKSPHFTMKTALTQEQEAKCTQAPEIKFSFFLRLLLCLLLCFIASTFFREWNMKQAQEMPLDYYLSTNQNTRSMFVHALIKTVETEKHFEETEVATVSCYLSCRFVFIKIN